MDSIGVLQCNTGRVLPSMLDGAQKEHQFLTRYRNRPEFSYACYPAQECTLAFQVLKFTMSLMADGPTRNRFPIEA